MSRPSKLLKKEDSSMEIDLETQSIPDELPNINLVLSPNVDYDKVTNTIDSIQQLGAPHSLTTKSISSPVKQSTNETVSNIKVDAFPILKNMGLVPKLDLSANMFKQHTPLHTPVGSEITGKIAIGAPKASKNVIDEALKQEEKVIIEDSNIPLNEDFLNFLMVKVNKSFGWVVDKTFLANFLINPESFEEDENFIFFIAPRTLNLTKTANTGFQKSEIKIKEKSCHIFLLKIIENPKNADDPYCDIINSAHYMKLIEECSDRGIKFLYEINPNQLWLSIFDVMNH